MRKKIIIIITILIVIFSSLIIQIIKNSSVKASDSDVYDIILFWGEANMVSWANTEGDMPSGFNDTYNFSKETDIDVDILEKTESTSLVKTPIEDNTAYIYKYLNNSFDEITSETYILGDGFDKSDYRDGESHGLTYNQSTGKLEKYVQGTSSHISIQTAENVNMIPEFCRTYYERTGHKVIAVTGAVGGATIESFLPYNDSNHKKNGDIDYTYEAIKENFKGAVNLANSKGYNVNGKYWVCFQGEGNVTDEAPLDFSANKENYEQYFTQVKNNMKNDLGTTLGAIVETTEQIGFADKAIGVSQMHNSQENLINNNIDIILGSSYDYDHYVPDEETYNSDNFITKKYLDYAGNKLEYKTAFDQAKKSVCYEQGNVIHFHSATLSQIGRDCANNIANALGYSNNFNDLQEISYSSITDDNAYYNNLEIPENMSAGDPFLIKEGDTYYLYATDNVYYTSTDLKNWENKGNWVGAISGIDYYWAPEVYKYNNKFYMLFSGIHWGNGYPYGDTSSGAVYIAEANNLGEQFTNVKKIKVNFDENEEYNGETRGKYLNYIDGSLLYNIDSEGVAHVYMYFKSEWKQNTYVVELNLETYNEENTEIDTKDLTMIMDREEDGKGWERHINEGPFVIEKNGIYYLMYSSGEYKNDSYSVGYATSDSPMGPFTKKTIEKPLLYGSEPKYENDKYVFDSDKYMYGTGHNMIFKTSEDEMYIVYHSVVFDKESYETINDANNKYSGQEISIFTGRKLNIDRVGIDSDGNLYVDGPSTVNQPLPSGTAYNGVTYSQLSSDQYSLNIDNNNEKHYLTDNISYLTQNVTSKSATTREISIDLNQRKDVTDIWLYGNGSALGFNDAIVDVSINDKYVIKDVSLGNSTCFKLNIPYNMDNIGNEHIKNIKIIADKEISVSEVKVVTTNSDDAYEDRYTITFNSNGGNEADTNLIKDIGSTIGTLPIVTKTGYTFNGWYTARTGGTQITSSTIVNGNVTYYAQWIANDTNYVVNHWQQNIGGVANIHNSSNYTKIETENLSGDADTEVTPNVKEYVGFTSPNTQTITIAADGGTEVNYYYTRNQYCVTLNKDEGINSVTGADTYYYGQSVTINAEVNENYIWVKWTGTDTLNDIENTFIMPAQNVELKANTIKKVSVTTKYIDINTNEELTEAIVDNGYEGKDYTTEQKEFEGYEFVRVDGATTGKMSENIVVIYYYKKSNSYYAVNHWQQNIGGAANIHNSSNYTKIETENLSGETDTEVTPRVKEYVGFTSPNTQTITIVADGGTEVNYYYTRNQYRVTLNKDEGINSVTGADTYYYGQSVTINAEVNENYIWVKWTGTDTLNDIENTFIMPAQNVELKANTIKKASVTTKYIDINTNEELTEAIVDNGYEGKDYTTEQKEFEGYKFVRADGATTGEMSENIVVIYYYKKSESSYAVNHWQQNIGGAANIHDSSNYTKIETENLSGETDTEVTPNVKEYTGFTSPNTQTITITANGGTEVNYYYTRNQYRVTLNKDEGINSVTGADTYYYGQSVTINAEVNENYIWVKWTGTDTLNDIENTFIMPAQNVELKANTIKKASVTTKYVDISTNEELTEDIVDNGYEGKEYTTEQKEFEGYKFVKVDGVTEGKMTSNPIEVVYYYGKITKIEVYYLDKTNNEIIADTKKIDGYVGKEYEVKPLQIDGYQYSECSNNTSGIMTEETIKIYFSYLKESGINVKYVNINTNEEIAKSKHYDLNSTEEYDVTGDYQDIESYTYIKDSGNTKGIATNKAIDIIYYYAYNSSITVRYIDKNTNKEIADSELIEGYEGKEYSLKEKEIKGYQYIDSNVELKGKFTSENIIIKLYYKMNDSEVDNDKTENDNTIDNSQTNNNVTDDNTTDNSQINNDVTDNNKTDDSVKVNNKIDYSAVDDTTSKGIIPNTGKNIIVILIITSSILISLIYFIKYKKYKGI